VNELVIPYRIFFDENGFYLFAEYAYFFTILALFLGPTIILEWLGLLKSVNIANVIGIAAFVCQIMFFHLFLHVGAMDYSRSDTIN
jgi:hypothetical protein